MVNRGDIPFETTSSYEHDAPSMSSSGGNASMHSAVDSAGSSVGLIHRACISSYGTDTIAAVATPIARAALGLIRISGSNTFGLLAKIFKPSGKRTFPTTFTAFYGTLIDPTDGMAIDKVIVNTYFAPFSYTGEDIAEITSHGNPFVMSKILAALFAIGARAAEPGEFTRRAFLNGKMDLLDVEATAQLLAATSSGQVKIALNQLDGLPSQCFTEIRDQLINRLVEVEAVLNFPEDETVEIDEIALSSELGRLSKTLDRFVESACHGDMISQGLAVVIVGRPNTGKSSLLNVILGRERAIVTEFAGTTRDTLEEPFSLCGVPIKLFDTAGLRPTSNPIEVLGIQRTREALRSAFLVLAIFDASMPITEDDFDVIRAVKESGIKTIAVLNKSDLSSRFDEVALTGFSIVKVSALTKFGLDELLRSITTIIESGGFSKLHDHILLGAQQMDGLRRASAAIKRIIAGTGGMYQDMLAMELEDAIRQLGIVTGDTVDINTLDRIFERFCIGK